MNLHCPTCTLATDYCICKHARRQPSNALVALLLHENEPLRPTGTAPVIRQSLETCLQFSWQRKEPPQALLELLRNPAYSPWLIFPADRPELAARSQCWQPPAAGKKALFIVPDGTWKEVRKMVRKSPWLDGIPILSFQPERPTRYHLRRNPDADHLCTAEVVSSLMELSGNTKAATAIDQLLTQFLRQYHQWQHHLPPAAE